MRLLCVSAQLPGHLDWGGYLRTAATLAQRGHNVLWASGAAVAAQVTHAGIAMHVLAETGWRWPPPPPLTPAPDADLADLQHQKQVRALDQWLEPARVAAAGAELTALARDFRPDLILSEMFSAAAGLVAEQVDAPLVVLGWPASASRPITAIDGMAQLARARLDDLLRPQRLTGLNFSASGPPALCSPHLHITYWTPSWLAGTTVAPQTVHVGGLATRPHAHLAPDPNLPHPDDAPWVLITLGTSFNADPNFFLAAAHAADQLGCLPLLATGAPLQTAWVASMAPRLPRRAVVRSHLDFAATLPYVAAAIHHGGAGTTHALATHAIPQIVVPHAADQIRQAQGLMRTGAGLHLAPKQVTIAALVDALAQALPDRAPLHDHAIALQTEMDALGGVPTPLTRLSHWGWSCAEAHGPLDGGATAAPKHPPELAETKGRMQILIERIQREGRNLGRGILKLDGFINHQLDPSLTLAMGKEFARRFAAAGVTGITKIITAEVSGIAPALTTGIALGVPVVYARKTQPITMASGVFKASAPSHTKGGVVELIISPEYLRPEDRVLLIDDFLASGQTIAALAELIAQCGATLCGIGCIVEKSFEGGRALLTPLGVPIVSLAVIESMEGDSIVVRAPE